MLAVPPPQIQTAPIMQQSSIITQNAPTMVTAPTQQVPTSQPQILHQQTIIPQSVPIQLHRPGNMVIQQPVQNNLSVPPPSITMKTNGQIMSQVQLSQPPPNIQIQPQQNQVATQIVLNQPQTYQYIPTTADPNQQQNQVTIQHIYQPQGIVQQTTQPINQFTQQQTTVRPPQPQQYIVQGNTA